MERAARRLANKIAASLGYDNEREQVVAYGMIALFQITATILGVLLFGLIIGAPVEALIICFSVSIFRKYSGGGHAGSIMICTIIAVIYSTVFGFISKHLLAHAVEGLALFFVIVAVFVAAFLVVFRNVPVDSPNKPITSELKRRRMRKGSFCVVTLYLTASLVLCFFGESREIVRSLCLSLLFGVAWQVFTLTRLGIFILGKTEKFSKNSTT